MKTIGADEERLLQLGDYAVVVKVDIEDALGATRELTDLEGRNFVKQIMLQQNVDSEVASGTVTLVGREYFLSLAPLMEASKLNLHGGTYDLLLEVFRDIEISARIVPWLTPRSAVVFVADDVVFKGKIDKVRQSTGLQTNELELIFRDEGGELQDFWIQAIQTYGSDADSTNVVPGGALEDIIQEILDQNPVSGGAPTLHTPVVPGFIIVGPWEVTKQGVLSACRQAAAAIGWEVRYKWRISSSQFELTLYEPDRTPAVVRTFAKEDTIEWTSFERDITFVRNLIEVSFQTDPNDPTTRATVTRTDATSVAAYGTRYMAIDESSSSPIDTLGEAEAFADAALADLKDPDLQGANVNHFFPYAELEDFYTFAADDIHFSTDIDVAVVAIRHIIDVAGRRGRTEFQVAPIPQMSKRRWWDRGQLPGGADIIRDLPPLVPFVTLDTFDHGILIQWDEVMDIQVDYYEVHQFTTTGFTPSLSTLIQRVNGNRYRSNSGDGSTGMDQRRTYFYKVIAVDKWGNKSAPSIEVSSAPGFLRGHPGIIASVLPDAQTLLGGQELMIEGEDRKYRRFDLTYQDLIQQIMDDCTDGAHYELDDDTSAAETPFSEPAVDRSGFGNDATYEAANGGNVIRSDLLGFVPGALIPDGGFSQAFFVDDTRLQAFITATPTRFITAFWFAATDEATDQHLFSAGSGVLNDDEFVVFFRDSDNRLIVTARNVSVDSGLKDDFQKVRYLDERRHFFLAQYEDQGGGGGVNVEVWIDAVRILNRGGVGAGPPVLAKLGWASDIVVGAGTPARALGFNFARLDDVFVGIDPTDLLTEAEIQKIYRRGLQEHTDYEVVTQQATLNASEPLPAMKVYINTGGTTLASGATARVPWDAIVYDHGGYFDVDGGVQGWTAPRDCIVHVSWQLFFNSSGTHRQLSQAQVNGGLSSDKAARGYDSETARRQMGSSVDIELEEGDRVDIGAFQTSGGPLTYSTNPALNWMTLHVVRWL